MSTPIRQPAAPPSGLTKAAAWDSETMNRLDREGEQVCRALQAKTNVMRTVTPDDLKVRSR
jgi:hypothetical protein